MLPCFLLENLHSHIGVPSCPTSFDELYVLASCSAITVDSHRSRDDPLSEGPHGLLVAYFDAVVRDLGDEQVVMIYNNAGTSRAPGGVCTLIQRVIQGYVEEGYPRA